MVILDYRKIFLYHAINIPRILTFKHHGTKNIVQRYHLHFEPVGPPEAGSEIPDAADRRAL